MVLVIKLTHKGVLPIADRTRQDEVALTHTTRADQGTPEHQTYRCPNSLAYIHVYLSLPLLLSSLRNDSDLLDENLALVVEIFESG